MRFTHIARALFRASNVWTHDYAKEEAPERRGTGPLRHQHARLSIYWEPRPEQKGHSDSLDIEWSLFNRSHKWIGWSFKTSAGEIKPQIGLGILALYFTFNSWRWKELSGREWGMQYSFGDGHGFDAWGTFRWEFAQSSMEWRSGTPWWARGSWYPHESIMGAILGRATVETTTLSTHDVLVPMPEASYPATVKIEQRTTRRARLPWPTSIDRSASIDITPGIPVPGKGENSWDCGLDAICGTGSSEPSIAAAIGAAVRSATSARLKYGGPNWTPPAKPESVPA
jgi:hypothetical protein